MYHKEPVKKPSNVLGTESNWTEKNHVKIQPVDRSIVIYTCVTEFGDRFARPARAYEMCVYEALCHEVMHLLLLPRTKLYCHLLCWPSEHEMNFSATYSIDKYKKTRITNQQRYSEWHHIRKTLWGNSQKRAISLEGKTVTTRQTTKRNHIGKAGSRKERQRPQTFSFSLDTCGEAQP